MADRKISDLTALTTPASGDYVPIVDISEAAAASKNKRITIQSLFQGIPVNVGIGTASPGTVLAINDPGTGLGFTNAASGNFNLGLLGGTGSNEAYVYQRANGPLLFGTNNTERLRIDSSGKLLVGASSASGGYLNNDSLVHVQAEAASAGITIHRPTTFAALAGPYLFFSRSRGTPAVIVNSGDNLGSIEWGGADGTDVESTAALIRAEVDGTPGANDMPGRLVFSTTADGSAAPTERLRIDSSGRVGIGTTSPSRLLTLYDAGTLTYLQLAHSGASGTSRGLELVLNSTEAVIINRENGPLILQTNNTEAVRITSAGNVGIGTSSPTTLLDLNADTVRVRTARTPASASATGATGEICWDASYIYVCTATNTWKRSALSTW